MSKSVYKCAEWQSPSGRWYVNCTNDLAGISGLWWVPCRVLDLPPAQFIMLLKDNYNASHFHYNIEKDVLTYSWASHEDAHRWMLYINRVARNKNFII